MSDLDELRAQAAENRLTIRENLRPGTIYPYIVEDGGGFFWPCTDLDRLYDAVAINPSYLNELIERNMEHLRDGLPNQPIVRQRPSGEPIPYEVDRAMCGTEGGDPSFDLEDFCLVLQGCCEDLAQRVRIVPIKGRTASNTIPGLVPSRVMKEALSLYLEDLEDHRCRYR